MFDFQVAYYAWMMALIIGCAAAWATNFVMLPGNWMIVGLAALFVSSVVATADGGMGWDTVTQLIVLAVIGEGLEFMAGAAGAAKKGGSKRSVVLALLGALSGSIIGAVAGLPIPVIGTLVGALAGAGAGAFVGAWLGEAWKGRSPEDRVSVGQGAMVGRLLGTVGKLAVGMVMIGVVAVKGLG